MKKIKMVDLKGQYNLIKNEVDKAVLDVIESTSFINGPSVKLFQKDLEKYLGVRNVIPCANGTDALQICLMGLRLIPGDEIITTDFTFASTVEVIELLGLTPVLIDIDPVSFNIDIDAVKKALTSRTKAIIPVHLFGQAAKMDELMEIADENNIFVIEDNAQAMGAKYSSKDGTIKKTGSIGHLSATSFFPSKNLGAYGDGGAISTNDDNLAEYIRGIVNHGMYKRYYHDVVGVNSRLDSIQAAILKVKLKYLDDYNERRKKAASLYTELLINHPNIITPKVISGPNSHVFHQYTIRIVDKNRDKLVEYLNKKNIPCGVYYPVPLHSQKAYKNSSYNEKEFTITNQICKEVISLPMHSELKKDQVQYIVENILSFIREN